MTQSHSLVLRPTAYEWESLAQSKAKGEWAGRSILEWQRLTREELGLDGDRVVIGTGHQAAIWHPGILAKDISTRALVESLGEDRAQGVHVVVDQDENEPEVIELPVFDSNGSIIARSVRLLASPVAGTPLAFRAASEPISIPEADWAGASIGSGLSAIHEALKRHHDSPSAAEQVSLAVRDLANRWVSDLTLIRASSLLSTTFGRALVQKMNDDPRPCVDAYNDAVTANTDAGLTLLELADERTELPLWNLLTRADGMEIRDRAFAEDLAELSVDRVLPRALTMTAVLRLTVCDLFVHGRGGEAYDRVMEQWISHWLGLTPQPMSVASADVYLPMRGEKTAPSVEDAIHMFRGVWHDPARRNGESMSDEKREIIEKIASLPFGSHERRKLFQNLHETLKHSRASNAAKVELARQQIEDARRMRRERTIRQRRDWPFPVYPVDTIDMLSCAIRKQFSHSSASA